MRLIDADAFWKHFEEGKAKLLLIKSMLPPEMIDATLKIYAEIKEMIDSMPTIDPEPHWIPNTKETVPKDPLRKQIQLKNGWIITGWFDGEDWLPVPEVGAGLLFDNVLAWMPLPSPYQPNEDEL